MSSRMKMLTTKISLTNYIHNTGDLLMTYTIDRMTYMIARMNDDGSFVALESFDSYNEAELNINGYFNMYPDAYVDIVASLSEHTTVVLN